MSSFERYLKFVDLSGHRRKIYSLLHKRNDVGMLFVHINKAQFCYLPKIKKKKLKNLADAVTQSKNQYIFMFNEVPPVWFDKLGEIHIIEEWNPSLPFEEAWKIMQVKRKLGL